MKKFYLINKETNTLETFYSIDDLSTRLWGAWIENYIIVVSRNDRDFFYDIGISRGDLNQITAILKLY
jgi:hypothetical protein